MTRKGQVTIPKALRQVLNIRTSSRVLFEVDKIGKGVTIKPALDFLKIAKEINVKQRLNPLKARELLERKYERN